MQHSHCNRHARATRLALAFLIIQTGVFCAGAASAESLQPPATITAAASDFVVENGLQAGTRRTIEVEPLDMRLRLAACPTRLAAATAPGVRSNLRMTVEVRCPVDGGWRLYVPVRIRAFDNAVVAMRALPRGHVLTAADLSPVEGDVSALPPGYARDAAALIGRRVVRPLSAGAVIGSGALSIEPTIRRGQQVTLLAQAQGVAVRAQGLAVTAGGTNELIRIKNLSSGREVEAIVRAEGLVEVPLH